MDSAGERFEAIRAALADRNNILTVKDLCELAGVSRSGYYNWVRSEKNRELREAKDRAAFEQILEAYRFRGYAKGVRGIHIISFLTGTSWGTIAIMVPIIAPLALSVSGGELSTVVYAAVATILGGATFGDHCSPISNTTILSSLAAGSDHIAHVKTQLPYALTCAAIGCIGYLEMSRNVQSGNTQNLKSTVIQRSFPKWSVAERRKTAAASDQAAVCACAHSRYFAGGSPSGLRV